MTAKTHVAALAAAGLFAAASPAALAQGPAPAPDIDPQAVQALQRMSAFLGTLTAFEVSADTTSDIVLDDGQKLELADRVNYKVRRPNGFVIERTNDYKQRRFIYDGKRLTVFSPRTAFYAQIDAPPTIRQTLSAASETYGIELPLRDLFRWSEPGGGRIDSLREGFVVGPVKIDGVDTDQYAFREADFDWQIWIQRGATPVPRKVVIVDHVDPAHPQYSANLSWNLKPAFGPATFAFQPPKSAQAIRLVALGQ